MSLKELHKIGLPPTKNNQHNTEMGPELVPLTVITDRTKLPLYPATYFQQKQLFEHVSNPVFLFNIQKSQYDKSNQIRRASTCRTFVQMPYNILGSQNDLLSNNNGNGPIWNSIEKELNIVLEEFKSSQQQQQIKLESIIHAIQRYNISGFNFIILSTFFETGDFYNIKKALQHLIEQALALPKIIPHPIPLLQIGENKTIVMSQQQVFSLLANAFLCTFWNEPPKNFPCINFFRLFSTSSRRHSISSDESKLEKLKCIFNYFYQMYLRNNFELWSHGKVITYERRCLAEYEMPYWESSNKLLSDVELNINGKIEDCGKEMLQVDFANQFVGGGILEDGALMEEIRFSICPELIAARLFTEKLAENEVLVVTGAEQFSSYEGYGHTFKYVGPFDDPTRTDNMGRIGTEIVAMDALKFYPNRKWEQFSLANITRELHKCYTGFMLRNPTAPRIPIASGNWGCGPYSNGDPELKFLIQWLAASQAERKFVMFVFTHHEQANSIEDIVIFLKRHRVTVKTLYKLIELCSRDIFRQRYRGSKLFQMIQNDIRCLNILRDGDLENRKGNSFKNNGIAAGHNQGRGSSKGRRSKVHNKENGLRTGRKQQECNFL